jgi:alkylation response protein AidB-like acyl-CoA dehydrogenase
VDFRYTEEQEALRDTLQRFIARDYGFERRRELARSSLGFSEHAWQTYAELGLLALPFPKDLGGLEGDGVDVMLVMEQVGRGLLLEPYLSTVVLCGGLIRDAAPAAMRAAIVPEIASGKLKLALGAYEPQGRYDLHRILSSAARSGSGWRISGRKSVALDAPSADYFVISARTQPATGEPLQDLALFLVPREARGVSLLAYPTQSGGRAADIALADVYVDESALIAPAGLAHAILERAVDRAAAALCAEAVGIAGMLNQTTLEYLKTRRQFGTPIGAFQALQHRMADMYIAEEQMRSMAIAAAVQSSSDDALGRHRAVAGAKAYIGEAARLVGQQAIQMHGAMGMVEDCIVSHYFKRLTVIDMTMGDADFQLGQFSDSMRRQG